MQTKQRKQISNFNLSSLLPFYKAKYTLKDNDSMDRDFFGDSIKKELEEDLLYLLKYKPLSEAIFSQ